MINTITEIASILKTGKENAISGRKLCEMLGLTMRELTLRVEKERRAGAPICASTSGAPGYYMAANEAEIQDYCRRLEHRMEELKKTRAACLLAVEWFKSSPEQREGGVIG